MNHSTAVLERVRNLRRVGSLPADAPDVGRGETGTLDEGTVARIDVRVAEGRIVEARFKVFGCSAAIASASLVTERLEGAGTNEPVPTTNEIVAALELPEERRQVAALVVEAAERALSDWTRKAE